MYPLLVSLHYQGWWWGKVLKALLCWFRWRSGVFLLFCLFLVCCFFYFLFLALSLDLRNSIPVAKLVMVVVCCSPITHHLIERRPTMLVYPIRFFCCIILYDITMMGLIFYTSTRLHSTSAKHHEFILTHRIHKNRETQKSLYVKVLCARFEDFQNHFVRWTVAASSLRRLWQSRTEK